MVDEKVSDCFDQCLALIKDIHPVDRVRVIEHLIAVIALKMPNREDAHLILDGIRKHTGQIVDEFFNSRLE